VTNCVSEGKILYIVAALFEEIAFKNFLAQLECFGKIWYHLQCLKYKHF